MAAISESQRRHLKSLFKSYIETNDIEKLDNLLENRLNFKLLKKEKFLDPFVIAIRSNNLDIFNYLNEKGFKLRGTSLLPLPNQSPKLPINSYSFPLIEAIKCLNLDAVVLLISSLNIDVNSTNYKYVPLQVAYNIYTNERDKLILNPNRNVSRIEVSVLFCFFG
jgi:hypothetical protein